MRTTPGKRSRTCSRSWAPSMPGMRMSVTTTSQGWASNILRAASPPLANMTSQRARCGRSIRRRPSSRLGSSSTNRIRFMVPWAGVQAPLIPHIGWILSCHEIPPIRALMNSLGSSAAGRRMAAYGAVFVVLLASAVPLHRLSWHGDRELHTVLEAIATLLALVSGANALIRFYTCRTNAYLILGCGLTGAALLDGYHAVITSTFCD